jgi:hypothetical protein
MFTIKLCIGHGFAPERHQKTANEFTPLSPFTFWKGAFAYTCALKNWRRSNPENAAGREE